MKKSIPIIIDPKLDSLYVHLRWLGIGDYVFTLEFFEFCKRIGYRSILQMCYDEVEHYHNIPVKDYRDQMVKAFKKFLGALFEISTKEKFIKILSDLLIEYKKWSGKDLDLEKVKKDFLALKYTKTEITKHLKELL